MIVLGIDPGLSGGLAIVGGGNDRARVINCMSVPVTGEGAKRRPEFLAILAFIEDNPPDAAFIERAQAMPDQGSSSGFIYGRAVGYLEAAVAGMRIPLHVIESSAWKKHYALSGRDHRGDKLGSPQVKENSRQMALQRIPTSAPYLTRKLDHNRAEAILIAAYGRDRLMNPNSK